MRVLEQHPVGLVFFFVPQIVQALRTDELGELQLSGHQRQRLMLAGYVEQFIFETSKISQLFCHQIIWNMKANTYKDDNAVGTAWNIGLCSNVNREADSNRKSPIR